MKKQKYATFAKHVLFINTLMIKNYQEIKTHYQYTAEYRKGVINICHLKYSLLEEIPVVFHNRLNHDYRLTIKRASKRVLRRI